MWWSNVCQLPYFSVVKAQKNNIRKVPNLYRTLLILYYHYLYHLLLLLLLLTWYITVNIGPTYHCTAIVYFTLLFCLTHPQPHPSSTPFSLVLAGLPPLIWESWSAFWFPTFKIAFFFPLITATSELAFSGNNWLEEHGLDLLGL